MFRSLDLVLRRVVSAGNLELVDAQGRSHRYGDGAGPPVVARIADRWLERQLVLDPHLALGEGYMSGRLLDGTWSDYDLLALLASNVHRRPLPSWTTGFDAARFIMRRIMQFNPTVRAQLNAAHHYDIDGAIYDLFLDRDRQYSAPISQTAWVWTQRSSPRSATSPPSSRLHRDSACSTSGRAGEGSEPTLSRPWAPTSLA